MSTRNVVEMGIELEQYNVLTLCLQALLQCQHAASRSKCSATRTGFCMLTDRIFLTFHVPWVMHMPWIGNKTIFVASYTLDHCFKQIGTDGGRSARWPRPVVRAVAQ